MNDLTKILEKHGLPLDRMITISKSGYIQEYPNGKPIFNANIFTLEDGKVWYGDLDLKFDAEALQNSAKEIGKDLYILREMDGRFENENLGIEYIKSKVAKIIN